MRHSGRQRTSSASFRRDSNHEPLWLIFLHELRIFITISITAMYHLPSHTMKKIQVPVLSNIVVIDKEWDRSNIDRWGAYIPYIRVTCTSTDSVGNRWLVSHTQSVLCTYWIYRYSVSANRVYITNIVVIDKEWDRYNIDHWGALGANP